MTLHMRILVTGGAGYIGSHTCVELLNSGHEVIVFDNLLNSKREAINRVEKITGKNIKFYQADLLDPTALEQIFSENEIELVLHFAGLKAVGGSVAEPLNYYENNVSGSINLLKVMTSHKVKNIVFSSSAVVYGQPKKVPITEKFPLSATNPYAWTKIMIEEILIDIHHADPVWNIAILRYFNPVGAHPSGLIGEDPQGIPNNLMPFVSQVASGKLDKLSVFGNDYPTKDGTGVRDYIHVVDLAQGHLAAMNKLAQKPGVIIYNLGTGQGYSVFELVKAFEKASGKNIPFQITPRRPGDIAVCFADPTKAKKELNWKALKNLNDMCVDTWRWQSQNPQGYPG